MPYAADWGDPEVGGKWISTYWHLTNKAVYAQFLQKFANHVGQEKYRRNIFGIRLNFDAVGTEHFYSGRFNVNWTIPNGVKSGAFFFYI